MAETLIPKASTILVTGANSFIASHIADQLLIDGFNVRGSVRSEAKGKALQKHFDGAYGVGRFECVIVEDITIDGAFDEAVKSVEGICHVATSASLTADASDVIEKTAAGALSIFESAIRESGVKTVVYTSDSYAVYLPEANKARTISASDYNEYAVKAVLDPVDLEKIRATSWDPSSAIELVVWSAAKAHAEEAVWRFVEEKQPSFQVSSVIPNMNFGAPVGNLPLSSTGKTIPDLLLNKPNPDLYFPCQYFVNVRDCAKVHVAALLDPNQTGKRLFACAAPFNWNDILKILRELRPEARIRDDFDGLGRDMSILPNGEAEELLWKRYGHGWKGLEETVRENVAEL